jgi:16S rRNA processing protein RimM
LTRVVSAGHDPDAGPEAVRDILEIGRVVRPHGLRGEVVVELVSNVSSRLDPGAAVLSTAGPLVVVTARPHQRRWLVRFEDVDDLAAAEGLRGAVLSAPAAPDPSDPDALFVHQLIGAVVVDAAGVGWGPVTDVLDNPASDLLVLESGALVPLTFVEELADGVIRLSQDTPAGLLGGDVGRP